MKDLDWRILKVLNEKKSITQAAEDLYMTQSALTKRIKTIENEWNIEIVNRTSRGITFTEDGSYLVNKAVIMIDFLDEITQHFRESEDTKELVRIGVPNSFARLHMSRLMRAYMETYDELQFQTVSNSSDVIIRQLIDETIDMGIVCGDYNFIGEKVKLFDENLYILTPKGVKIDDVASYPLIESYLNPLVKSTVDQWWKRRYGSKAHDTHSVPYSDIAFEMVENGLGVSFVFGNQWKINEEKMEIYPVYDDDGEAIARSVWLMLTDHCFKSQKMMDFISFIEQYYHVNE